MKWKAHIQDWAELQSYDHGTYQFVCLSQREAAFLLSAIGVFRWGTRWVNHPGNAAVRDWTDNMARKLMCDPCCDAVASCIETDEGIREIIREIIRNETEGTGTGDDIGDNVPELAGCDNDAVWSAVSYLVNYLDTAAVDTFEKIEAATNIVEIAGEWADNIPVLGNVMAFALDYLSWLQDSTKEGYLANMTQALKDEYKCDLFCLYKANNCDGLTLIDLAGYFLGRIGGQLQETFEDLVRFIITGTWTGSQIVDAMLASMVGMIALGEGVGFVTIPNGYYSLRSIMAIGANNPDADWSILCDQCPLQYAIIDYTASDGGATASRGSWMPGSTSQGWVTEFYRTYINGIANDYRERLILQQLVGPLWAEEVEITFDWNAEKYGGGSFQLDAVEVLLYYEGALIASETRFDQAIGQDQKFGFTFPNQQIDTVEVRLTPMDIGITEGSGVDADAEAILTKIKIGYR